MKPALTIARILVGILFIFSGLVKANDPHGLSYKMQEFFELWGMTGLNSWSLLFSVLMNAFEIIAGFALLLGWRINLFSWLLLLLILFFTFLTGWTYVTGKPTNCGCFGDCLVISSKASFIKDLVLTVLIGFLFWNRRKIKPLFSERANTLSMLGVTIFSFGFQWWVLNYLPLVDCLPFKKGNNIPEKMKSPPGSRPDSFAIRFIYEKGGTSFEFSPSELPADLGSYTFKDRIDKLVRKGNAEPPIKGFVLRTPEGEDFTETVLSKPRALLLFCEDFSIPVNKWKKDFENLRQTALQKNIPVYVITSSVREAKNNLPYPDLTIFECDFTAIRTAARTNPCLYLIQKGTVTGKWSYKKISDAENYLKKQALAEHKP